MAVLHWLQSTTALGLSADGMALRAAASSDENNGTAWLSTLSSVCGWAYFLAWSLSFYPQFIENFRRRSVIGLSFEFLMINVSGYVMYSLFNCCMYWSPEIKREYFEKYPNASSIPVKLNDIFFALHGFTLTALTITQCFFFERGNQKLNKWVALGTGVGWSVAVLFVILGAAEAVTWLTTIYAFSYLKLTVTATKYVPQAYLNYRRKCTKGWSVGQVTLDMAGGILSLLQMVIDGINLDNWSDFWGDPVKVGLSVFTLAFDSFFLFQHYGLYHHSREPERPSERKPLLSERSGDPVVAPVNHDVPV